jgi:peptide/nickel transport system ATP-binding protein
VTEDRLGDRRPGSQPLLEVADLRVTYDAGAASVQALRGVNLRVGPGDAVGVVGESGSGKTTLALATLRLLPAEAAIEGSVRLGGEEVVGAPAEAVRRHRGRTAAYVIQAPGRGFNPVRTIGSQVAEPMRLHLHMSKPDAQEKTARLARLVELDPELLDRYAHELSGGERQRAMLAMALACDPPLLVLDEPTSGLDSTTKAAISETLGRLRHEQGLALLVISHDFSLMADLTDDLAVLYGGIVLEHGPTRTILTDPRQPYSRDLLGAYPSMTTQKDLRGIRGSAPDPADPPTGCPYHPRCSQAIDECATWPPELSAVAGRRIACLRGGVLTRLAAVDVAKSYRTGLRRRVDALKSVSLKVREGEVVGIVGETGSGKSTLVRVLVGVEVPDAGTVGWEGRPLATFEKQQWADFRRRRLPGPVRRGQSPAVGGRGRARAARRPAHRHRRRARRAGSGRPRRRRPTPDGGLPGPPGPRPLRRPAATGGDRQGDGARPSPPARRRADVDARRLRAGEAHGDAQGTAGGQGHGHDRGLP